MTTHIEPLETRRLLAGNVSASLSGGTLLLTGDDAANHLAIVPTDAGRTLQITPRDGTRVNGSAGPIRLPAASVLRVQLADGDDRLDLRGLSLSRLTVDTADGHDRVTLRNVTITGPTRVRTGQGDDRLVVRGSIFSSDTKIEAGAGENQVDRELILNWDFARGLQGWRTNVADFDPVINPQKSAIQFKSAIQSARAETGIPVTVLKLSGQNLSDDLLMYLTKQLTAADGIVANQAYNIEFTVTYLSDRPTDWIGGGSEYLKVGAVDHPISRFVDPETGLYDINIRRGNQVPDGPDASRVGLVSNGQTGNPRWTTVTQRHTHRSTPAADSSGNLYLFAGTESTFETQTSMRYVSIGVKLTPVQS